MTSSASLTGKVSSAGSGLQAVLLDMDGTLVETEDLWWQAEVEVFRDLGHEIADEHRQIVVGGPMARSVGHLMAVTGTRATLAELSTAIDRRFLHIISRGVPLMPGARRLLSALAAHQVPTALVSASHRLIVDTVLRSLGPEHFAFSVAGDEIGRTKPHPDPYLLAAARLGAEPSRCVVVEDTPTGVAAAEAAGCQVLVVPSIVSIPPAPGRHVVHSLEHVDPGFLSNLIMAAH